VLLIFPIHLYAVDRNPIEFANAEQEKRFSELIEELLRNKIHEGQTDEEITDFMVERYGDFVLYNPPLKPKTYVLWLGPLVLVLIGLIVLVYFIRRHAQITSTPPSLTEEERHKIKQMLDKEN